MPHRKRASPCPTVSSPAHLLAHAMPDRYLAAMAAAANFAFANRQVSITSPAQLWRVPSVSVLSDHGLRMVYDVAHNIAKWEEHR